MQTLIILQEFESGGPGGAAKPRKILFEEGLTPTTVSDIVKPSKGPQAGKAAGQGGTANEGQANVQ